MQFTPQITKRTLTLVFIVMLMDIVGLSLLFPIAPYIVKQYSNAALMVTILSVIYAGAQFFAAPALGKISDRVGRRPVLLISVFGSAVGYFIFGIGGALWILFLSRLIDGITGGNMSTAMATIADISKSEDRPKNFVLVGMAYGLGFILGPAMGGALGQLSLNAPVFAAGTISLIEVTLIYFMLPESLPKERRETQPLHVRDLNPFASIGDMLRKPGLGQLLIVYALFNLGFDGVNSIAGVFISRKFTAEPWHLGALFVVSGIALAMMQAAFTPKLVNKFGAKSVLLSGLLGNAIGGLLIFSVPALWMLFPVYFLSASFTGFIWAPASALITNRVTEREQGQLAGVNAALGGLMSALGPLWGGLAYDHIIPGSPYWISAIIIGLACILLTQVKVRAQANHQVGAQSPAD
jgi:DHA1 family tetracycline resistance protein-like MFS transporter